MKDDEIDIIRPVNMKFFNAGLKDRKHVLFNKINFAGRIFATILNLTVLLEIVWKIHKTLISKGTLSSQAPTTRTTLIPLLIPPMNNKGIRVNICRPEATKGAWKNKGFVSIIDCVPERNNLCLQQTLHTIPDRTNLISNKFFERQHGKVCENRKNGKLPLLNFKYHKINGLYTKKLCRTAQIAGFSENFQFEHPSRTNKSKKNVQKNAIFSQNVSNIAEKYANFRESIMLNNVNGIKNFLVKIQAISQFLTSRNSHFFNFWRLHFVDKFQIVPSIIYCSKSNYEVAKNHKIQEQWTWYQQKLSN